MTARGELISGVDARDRFAKSAKRPRPTCALHELVMHIAIMGERVCVCVFAPTRVKIMEMQSCKLYAYADTKHIYLLWHKHLNAQTHAHVQFIECENEPHFHFSVAASLANKHEFRVCVCACVTVYTCLVDSSKCTSAAIRNADIACLYAFSHICRPSGRRSGRSYCPSCVQRKRIAREGETVRGDDDTGQLCHEQHLQVSTCTSYNNIHLYTWVS